MNRYWLLLIFLVSFSAQAQMLVTAQGGYLKLAQDAAQDKNVSPGGLSYGAGIGVRRQYLEFESLFLKGSGEDDIVHDNADNKLVHQQSSLIFALNFYLSKNLYARFGYGLHKVHQELKTPVSEASEAGAVKAYGMQDDALTEGVIFGAGYIIARTKKIDCFVQLEKYEYTTIKSGAWNASLGIRIYLDGYNRSW